MLDPRVEPEDDGKVAYLLISQKVQSRP